MLDGSGVSREAPAPFCERLGVRFPRPTHRSRAAWGLVVLTDNFALNPHVEQFVVTSRPRNAKVRPPHKQEQEKKKRFMGGLQIPVVYGN